MSVCPGRLVSSVALVALLGFSACENNIGRAFDRNGGGGGGGAGDATNIEAPVVGSVTVDGRPRILDAFPSGNGWEGTVPIVVVFNESMSLSSISPQGGQPTVFVRAQGTPAALPATIDLLLGGTVVVIRPATALPGPQTGGGGGPIGGGTGIPTYEVVVSQEARDLEGIRVGGTSERIAATFQVDREPTGSDAKIVATLPVDNEREATRETPVYVFFSRLVTGGLDENSFFVRPEGGNPIAGEPGNPLRIVTPQGAIDDTRVWRIDPTDALAASTRYELVVTDAIQFGSDGLDFRGRTPYARFTTIGPLAPTSVAVTGAAPGFPDKINLQNFGNVGLDVALGADTQAGDIVSARVYGRDPRTRAEGDINFIERRATAPGPGAQTVVVPFGVDALGTIAEPRFEDGSLTLVAQVRRGSRSTGFIVGGDNDPRQDLVAPTLTGVGPANLGTSTTDFATDQEQVAMFGVASERIGAATLTAGGGNAELFASNNAGEFLLRPLILGRRTGSLEYQLTFSDQAGNMVQGAVGGRIHQRGVVTGTQSGTLVVEAYDDATLEALQNVTVLIEPGLPQKPAVGRQSMMTGADGRATFTGLAAGGYTITLIGGGYHLTSLVDCACSFASLPLQPLASTGNGPTASLGGRVTLPPNVTGRVMIGHNGFDDRRIESVVSSTSATTTVPTTPIRPTRPQVVTVLSGTFEPTAFPAFNGFACLLCGTGTVTAPPLVGVDAGEASTLQVTVAPRVDGSSRELAAAYVQDIGAAGLDTGSLIGAPTVRVLGGLNGLPGMTLFGVGRATATTGTNYSINATYSTIGPVALDSLAPVLWVSTEAQDRAGNISRHRRLLLSVTGGTTVATTAQPGVPTVSNPGGTTTGSPAVTFQDRQDPTGVAAGFGFSELVVTDTAGRQWRLIRQDATGAVGATTIQLPDLTGSGLTGLAAGRWSIYAEQQMLVNAFYTATDFVLDERFRLQLAYARSAPVDFTVQ